MLASIKVNKSQASKDWQKTVVIKPAQLAFTSGYKKSHPDKVRRQQNEYRDNISNLENQLSVVAQQISQKQRELTENQSRIANL
ncbi:HlyD family type I secretion periplasmic adaptor subunit, partial [Photobacterium damselae]|nr:HlyD family type I secretion periplasmic adaptor subunit [Photobacterium damselae]